MNGYLEETGDAVGHVGLSSGERLRCGTPQSAGSHGHVGLSSGERPRCGTPRRAITLVNASAKAFSSCKGPGKPEWALICATKYFLSLCLMSFCKSDNREKIVVLFSGILAVSI